MVLAARTRWTLRRYWAERVGVPPGAFEEPGVTVGQADEGGVHLFCVDGARVIGAPDSLRDGYEQQGGELATIEPGESDGLRAWVGGLDGVERVLGPTFYGYTDRETVDPIDSAARVLGPADEPAYEAFRATIPDDDWAHGGPSFTPDGTVGLFDGDDLVAAAGYDVWDELIAHIAVVTHPDHRDAGCGQAVVSRVTDRALTAGFVPQYRTLDAWPWSVAVAERLGFERVATAYLGLGEA